MTYVLCDYASDLTTRNSTHQNQSFLDNAFLSYISGFILFCLRERRRLVPHPFHHKLLRARFCRTAEHRSPLLCCVRSIHCPGHHSSLWIKIAAKVKFCLPNTVYGIQPLPGSTEQGLRTSRKLALNLTQGTESKILHANSSTAIKKKHTQRSLSFIIRVINFPSLTTLAV